MRKLLIIDNNTLSRESIVNIVYCIENETVVYEAEILEHAANLNVNFDAQDVVVYKHVYQKQDNFDYFNKLNNQFPLARKLIISHSNNKLYFKSLLEQGAHGVLNISCSRTELVAALRSIKAGELFLSNTSIDKKQSSMASQGSEKKRKMILPFKQYRTKPRNIDFNYEAMCFANKLFIYERGLSQGTIIPDRMAEKNYAQNSGKINMSLQMD